MTPQQIKDNAPDGAKMYGIDRSIQYFLNEIVPSKTYRFYDRFGNLCIAHFKPL